MSLQRVTSNLSNNDMQFHMRNREVEMSRINNRIAGQSRILNPRDDPVGAAHATRYASYNKRLDRYAQNISFARSNNQVTEGYLIQAVDILQRIRELGIQGANGTFTEEDRRYMATEVNQLFEQLVEIGNSRNGDGSMVFAGTRVTTEPFRIVEGHVPGSEGLVATEVRYIGDIGTRSAEIAEGSYMPMNVPGNQAFWAENQRLIADVDVRSYVVPEDGSIFVNGVEVALKRGDTVPAILSKIGAAGAGVRGYMDPIRNSVALQTTSPQQIWLEEAPGVRVLQDLGLLRGAGGEPPDNLARDVTVIGGSTFDVVIRMRDALYRGDVLDIGGSAIAGVDSALSNILSEVGRLGAQNSRLDLAESRTSEESIEMDDRLAGVTGVDLPRAITELQMLEYAHRAALGVTGRILQPTLLDFLR